MLYIDLHALRRDRDQLWAEAAHLEAAGEALTLATDLWESASAQQHERTMSDPWRDQLVDVMGHIEGTEERIAVRTLLTDVLKIPAQNQGVDTAKRLAEVMRSLGWQGPKPMRINGIVQRSFSRELSEERRKELRREPPF